MGNRRRPSLAREHDLAAHALETVDLRVWPYAMALGASAEAKP